MYRELFTIPVLDLPVFGYGLMLVIGFLTAIELARYLARRVGIDPDVPTNLGILALVSGVAGARIVYLLQYGGTYFDPSAGFVTNLVAAVDIRSGGLVYYGGFLGGFGVLFVYALLKKLPIRRTMDIAAPALAIGIAFGRIGCLLNGCCWGANCELPWALEFPYESPPYVEAWRNGEIDVPPELLVQTAEGDRLVPAEQARTLPDLRALAEAQHSPAVHPTQLYSAITGFGIAAVVLLFLTLPHAAGQGLGLVMMLEGASRFVIEGLRIEPQYALGLTLSQWLGVCVVLAGLALFSAVGPLAGVFKLERKPFMPQPA
ncbi:MAG: prolipoprotein diacylglyceryl transferase [Phycisphaerae bacterium]